MNSIWWSSSSGRIELQFQPGDVAGVCHPGDNLPAVQALCQRPHVAVQLAKLDPEAVRQELREYGAWDGDELGNHADNLHRLVWCACWDLNEEGA
jgi:hypothetical protein